jgi:hypothetical protein
MENSNDTIGNRTRDLPACSTVPQPTAPPRTTSLFGISWNISLLQFEHWLEMVHVKTMAEK